MNVLSEGLISSAGINPTAILKSEVQITVKLCLQMLTRLFIKYSTLGSSFIIKTFRKNSDHCAESRTDKK